MTHGNATRISFLVISISCCTCTHQVAGSISSLYGRPHSISCGLVCNISSFVHEDGYACKCSDTIGNKTSFSIKIIAFNFSISFFNNRSPHIAKVRTWLCKFHCWTIVHKKYFFINSDNPRFSTDIEFNSVNLLVIFS